MIDITIDMRRSIPEPGSKISIISNMGVWFFALFLLAGYFKAEPRLAFIQTHIDITLLFFGLSFSVFLYHGLRNAFALRIPRDFIWMAILYILLAACLVGGLLHTQSIEYGFDKAMRFVFLTGWAFFGSMLLIKDFLLLRRFLWALVAIATIMAIYALLSYQGVMWSSYGKAFGGDHIMLGRTCGLGLLTIIVFLLPIERKFWVKYVLWITAVLLLWATLFSVSLGPLVALNLSLLLFFILSMHGFPRIKIDRFALQLFVVALFVAIIIALMSQELFSNLAYRVQDVLTASDISSTSRLSLYTAAFDLWAKSPIWGVGTGQFIGAWSGDGIQAYPHNIILELGSETGLIGVLVFSTMIGLAFVKGLFHHYTEKGLVRIVSRYLLIACSFALLNAMVSYDINGNKMLFTFVGLIAVIRHIQMPEAE